MRTFDAEKYYRDRYETRKAENHCVDCGEPNDNLGVSVYCVKCLDDQRSRQKQYARNKVAAKRNEVAARKRRGDCIGCGGKERYSKWRCRRCYSIYLVNVKGLTRHAARKRVGLCASCDNAIPEGTVRCPDCSQKRKDKHAERKADRICAGCGKPNDNPDSIRSCLACTAKHNQAYHGNREAGICVKCRRHPAELDKHVCAECKLYNRVKDRRKHGKLRDEVLAAYGGACKCCGETQPKFLHVDHTNNDGAAHRKQLGSGGTRIYTWLRKNGFPQEGFQLLCGNCNWAKGHYGECPHETERRKLQPA